MKDTIIDATMAVIAQTGYHDMTLEMVAARAGSSRPAIYRRWKSKQELTVAAIARRFRDAIPSVADTGDARRDVAEMLKGFTSLLRRDDMHRVILSVIPEIHLDDDLGQLFYKIEIGRRLFLAKAIMRGISRGDVPEGVNLDRMIDLVLGGIYFRVIFRDGIPPDDEIDGLVATVFGDEMRDAAGAASRA